MSSENLCFKIDGSKKFNKQIEIPTSKSFANRALILAATIKEPVILNNIPASTDVRNLINALKSIGLEIDENDSEITIFNSFPDCEIASDEIIKIETGDGGTTNRFLIPLLALGSNLYEIIPSHKMKDRPMEELDNVLKDLSVNVIRNDNVWFALQGPIKIKSHCIEVDCSESTQFATGLALTLSQFHVDIIPVNLVTSTPYWEMTLDLIQRMKTERVIDIPVDFSSLSYPMAFAALNGSVLVKNCFGIDRFQADSIFIKILENIGVSLTFLKEGLYVEKSHLKTFYFDAKDCPDLIPTLCFMASYIKGESIIKSVEVLKYKECDRLSEMMKIMNLFNIEYEYSEELDEIRIHGTQEKSSFVEYVPPVDHRMIMVGYLFMRNNNGGNLHNCQSVRKSFPNFFEIMNDEK